MKKLYVMFVFAFFHFVNLQGHIIGDFRSKTGFYGIWNDYSVWETIKGIYYLNKNQPGCSSIITDRVNDYTLNLSEKSTTSEFIKNRIFENVYPNFVVNGFNYRGKLIHFATNNDTSIYNTFNSLTRNRKVNLLIDSKIKASKVHQNSFPDLDIPSHFLDSLLYHPADMLEAKDINNVNLVPAEIKNKKFQRKNGDITGAFTRQSTKNNNFSLPFSVTANPNTVNVSSPVITYDKLRNGSTTNRLTVKFATITDNDFGINVSPGTKPRLYYKLSSNANVFVGNTSADNGWKWVESIGNTTPFDFMIDYSILYGGIALLNSDIQYFVVSQNLSPIPKVTFNPSYGAIGKDVTPEGMTAPVSPNLYTIVQSLPAIIKVGTGQTYTTLTASDGLFAAINASYITANTIVNITSDINEPGIVSLNQISEEGVNAGSLTLTIQSDGLPHTISSGNALKDLIPLISITGAKRLTINGGKSKQLTFRNTNINPAHTGAVFQFDSNSQNDTLTNCYLESNSTSNNYGVILIRSIGENIISIIQNDIRDARGGNTGFPTVGIYSESFNNKLNIIDNNIYNLKNFNSYGMYLNLVENGCLITGNSIFMENGVKAKNPFTGIRLYTSSNHLIKGNFIGGCAPKCGGSFPMVITGDSVFSGIFFENAKLPISTIQNNTIQNIQLINNSKAVFNGIKILGPITLSGNTIGSTIEQNSIQIEGTGTSAGIIQSYPDALTLSTIEKNIIANISFTSATGSPTFSALKTTGGTVRMNKIYNIGSTVNTLTPVIYGINNSYGIGVNEFSNNVISLNGGASTATTLYGFNDNSTTGTSNFYYNSINLYGSTNGTFASYAFSRTNLVVCVLINNILVNTRIGGSGIHYSIYSINTSGLTSNFNDFKVAGTTLGRFGKYDQTDLNAWKTVSLQDANSISEDPLFTSPTILLPMDISSVNGSGTAIKDLTMDTNGGSRNMASPTIGAYELNCSNPTNGGIIASDQIISNSSPALISNSTSANGYSGLLEYKWQYAEFPFTTWNDILASNASTYLPGAITQTTMFKRLARTSCMHSWTGAAESNPVTISVGVNKWKGVINNNWNNPENWTLTKVPNQNDDLIFDDSPLNDCFLDQNHSVNNITNNQSTYLLNTNGNRLTVKGNLNLTNGAQINASSTNSELVFSGNTFQTIPSDAFVNNRVYGITIDNATGVSPVSDLTIDHLLTINSGKQLVIPTEKLLNVEGTINNLAGNSGLIIKASSTGENPNGSVIFHNDASKGLYVPATVEMFSKASKVDDSYKWQFFGIPLKSVQANPTFSGSYIREMHENVTGTINHWTKLDNESVLTSFTGYEITQDKSKVIRFEGNLENADFNPAPLSYTSEATYKGQHLIGNPYMAAINIKNDQTPANALIFGNGMDKTVYLYNTGSFEDWSQNGLNGSGNNDQAGQYLAIPQENAGNGLLPGSIPSMQAFLVMVNTPGETATISIPYNSTGTIVKNTSTQRAPAKEKIYTRIDVKGSNFGDHMWIFTDPLCTRGFDNGWDGYKMMGSVLAPQIYSMEEDGDYQVNSLDDINNTSLGFRAGVDSMYTMTFTHSNKDPRYKKIYLIDISNNKTVDITTSGSHYNFNSNMGLRVEKRFKIFATQEATEITTEPESNKNDNHSLKVFNSNNVILVINKSDLDGYLYIYNIIGRFIQKLKFYSNGITTLPVQIPTGTFLLKAVTLSDEVNTKIIVRE